MEAQLFPLRLFPLLSIKHWLGGDGGLFPSQSVKLTPGTYPAVGIRNGYRDVRQEFSVSIDGQAPVVTVTCKEAI